MTFQSQIERPKRLFASNERNTSKGAVFIGPKSKWWPKQVNTNATAAYARETYRQSLMASRKWRDRIEIRNELRGKDIASSCPPDKESFVDVLLDIANSGENASPVSIKCPLQNRLASCAMIQSFKSSPPSAAAFQTPNSAPAPQLNTCARPAKSTAAAS
jgi:hypothetical protein